MKNLLIVLIFGLAINKCMALDFECPESIDTKQSLATNIADWTSLNQSTVYNLDYALFSDGNPSERAFLHPDDEMDDSKGSSTWTFEDSSNIWLVCMYRKTTVVLSRKLPSGIKQCSIAYDKSKGIEVQGIQCL